MPKSITISLDTPLTSHDGPVRSIVLREPNGADYIDLGEPFILTQTKDGGFYHVELDSVIKAYVERCLVEPKEPLLLRQMSLTDAMKVREAIGNFFAAARRAMSQQPATS